MWPFKKKKIYKVEYKDKWGDYGCTIVKAYDESGAWHAARAMYSGSYQPMVYLSIVELHDA
jgi:hypothetical protein